MLYLTCTTISSVDLAQYGIVLAKIGGISVECVQHTVRISMKFFFSCPILALQRFLLCLEVDRSCQRLTFRYLDSVVSKISK